MEGWKYKQMEWSSGDLIYAGYNMNVNAPDADGNWEIYKYTWDVSDIVKIQRANGTWTGRASLF